MRIAIVNDVRMAVEAIRRALVADGGHSIAWTAADGAEAVQKCASDTPDLVLMDLIMPTLDGVEATRRIMAASPCAILVVTATMQGNSGRVFEALGAGALDAVQTPEGPAGAGMLCAKIDFLGRRIAGMRQTPTPWPRGDTPPSTMASAMNAGVAAEYLVAIGASAGGPAAVADLLSALPPDFPGAVIVVQHIDGQFSQGLVDWLGTRSRLPVRAARSGERPVAGEVRVAMSERHLVLDAGGRIMHSDEPAGHIYLPSIDVFFASMARHWRRGGAGVLLTGMGRDGAAGLLALREAGFPTIAQDRASSAVYGMPKAATELGAARDVLPLAEIAPRLKFLASRDAAMRT